MAGRAETLHARRHTTLIAAALLAGSAWACGGQAPPATAVVKPAPPPAAPTLPPDAADCGPGTSTTDPAVVAVVRARGNTRLDKEVVCRSLSVRAGDHFDASRVASDIHALWDTRAFDDVSVERQEAGSGGVLTYTVRERPLLGRVVIEGVTAIAASTLRPLTRLHEGEPLDVADVASAGDAIRALYLESGYRSVKADYRIDASSPAAAVVSFRVDEGPLALVKSFVFTGLSIVADRELRPLIETRKGTVNAPGTIYSGAAAARTVLLVQAHLYDRGLLQSSVDPPVSTLSPDGKALTVTLGVHEGPVYRIGKVTFAGALAADKATYLRMLGQKPGDVFNRAVLVQAFERIQAMHAKLGKPVKDISPETELDPDKKTVALTIGLAPQ